MIKHFIFSITLLTFIASVSIAQVLPIDTTGKVTYYEIVEAPALKKELLYENALTWVETLKGIEDKVVIETTDVLAGKIVAKNEFPLFSQTGVLKKLSGKVTYQMTIEMKDNLYRYKFTDFVFHYYKQDRTYKIVATGKTKKLEDLKAAGWQKLWNKHRAQTAAKIQTDLTELKIQMATVPVSPTKEAEKKKEIKWDN
jgi:hypothetical protein